MTSQEPSGVHLDRIHAAAIYKEIGERLHATLRENPNRLPPHLLRLTEGFDRGDAAFKALTGIDTR